MESTSYSTMSNFQLTFKVGKREKERDREREKELEGVENDLRKANKQANFLDHILFYTYYFYSSQIEGELQKIIF